MGEEKIPVNHAHDAVGSVLGQSAAVKFATNLKAGTTKHTTWKDINKTLVKQGEQTHHIAKIAAKLKPTQYESVEELDEVSRQKLSNYISAAKGDTKERSVGIKLAQKKKWGDSKFGTTPAKVPANEEVEELDEVSIATLDSYRKKSFDEPGFKRQAGRALAFNKLSSHGDSKVKSSEEIDVAKSQIKDLIKPEHHSKYPISKITSMSHGRKIYKDASAAGHLKEEVEELEELSKATLGSYVKKASDDKADFAFQQGQLAGNQTKNKVAIQTSIDNEKKRRAGVSKAVGKLTKEEVEELEELSKKTLGSYIKKSIVDAAHKTRIAGDPSVKNVPGSGVDKRIDAGEKAVKRERNTEKAINKLTRESIELEEGNFEKNMDIIKSGKLPPHIQAILDKRGAKGNDAIMAKGRAEKLKSMKEMLDEARAKKEPMEVYHTGYSAALQHAEKHLNKQGYEIHPDDWQHHISHGPSKPSEGKTVQLHVPLHKDGVKTKKVAHIQVYNRGNTIPKNNELNMYVL